MMADTGESIDDRMAKRQSSLNPRRTHSPTDDSLTVAPVFPGGCRRSHVDDSVHLRHDSEFRRPGAGRVTVGRLGSTQHRRRRHDRGRLKLRTHGW